MLLRCNIATIQHSGLKLCYIQTSLNVVTANAIASSRRWHDRREKKNVILHIYAYKSGGSYTK
jgi:hypothetical protein